MCGIVGVMGRTLLGPDEDFFHDMLRMDVVRGPHSTGVLLGKNWNKSYSYYKDAVLPDTLIGDKEYKTFLGHRNNLLIGHNRWATTGDINGENAHPFHHGSVIGVHNGTLRQRNLLPDHKEFEVDSDNIFYALDKEGAEAVIPKLAGAYVLAWIDSKDDTFNLIRNGERPLYWAQTRDGLAFASEAWMLRAAAGRRRFKYELGEVKALPIDTLYTYSMEEISKGTFKPEEKKLKGKAYSPPKRYNGGNVAKKAKGGGKKVSGNNSSGTKATPKTSGCHNLGKFWRVGQTLDFVVTDYRPSGGQTSKMWTLRGYACIENRQEILAYVSPTTLPLIHKMLDNNFKGQHECTYRSVVTNMWRRVTKTNDLVVLLDGNQIKYLPKVLVNKSKPKLLDRNGKEVSRRKFRQITSQGCAFCCETPGYNEGESLIWLEGTDSASFVCGACAESESQEILTYQSKLSEMSRGNH